jgi:hypothetical protein
MYICTGCDLPLPLNDLGLCADCSAKLERDLIRQRDWGYSLAAFLFEDGKREALRTKIIREYGAKLELLAAPHAPKKAGKNKSSHSRNTKRKREIAKNAIRDYDTETVLETACQFIQEQSAAWVNFSRLAQYLYERFYQLNPKRLGQAGKKYKSLLKFLADYPATFELRSEAKTYWIRLKN